MIYKGLIPKIIQETTESILMKYGRSVTRQEVEFATRVLDRYNECLVQHLEERIQESGYQVPVQKKIRKK